MVKVRNTTHRRQVGRSEAATRQEEDTGEEAGGSKTGVGDQNQAPRSTTEILGVLL